MILTRDRPGRKVTRVIRVTAGLPAGRVIRVTAGLPDGRVIPGLPDGRVTAGLPAWTQPYPGQKVTRVIRVIPGLPDGRVTAGLPAWTQPYPGQKVTRVIRVIPGLPDGRVTAGLPAWTQPYPGRKVTRVIRVTAGLPAWTQPYPGRKVTRVIRVTAGLPAWTQPYPGRKVTRVTRVTRATRVTAVIRAQGASWRLACLATRLLSRCRRITRPTTSCMLTLRQAVRNRNRVVSVSELQDAASGTFRVGGSTDINWNRTARTITKTEGTWQQVEIFNVAGQTGPKGDKGDKGDQGDRGPAGTAPNTPVASESVSGTVTLAREEDVADSETDLTRVPVVSRVITLVRRLIGENVRSIPEATNAHRGRPLVATSGSRPWVGYEKLGADGIADEAVTEAKLEDDVRTKLNREQGRVVIDVPASADTVDKIIEEDSQLYTTRSVVVHEATDNQATYVTQRFDLGYFADESALDATFYRAGRFYYNFAKYTPRVVAYISGNSGPKQWVDGNAADLVTEITADVGHYSREAEATAHVSAVGNVYYDERLRTYRRVATFTAGAGPRDSAAAIAAGQ